MYTFTKKIDGDKIEPNEGAVQTHSLPDFTTESKYVRLTLGANDETMVTLPENCTGFEIDTDLDELVINFEGAISLPAKITASPVAASSFQSGVIAPSDRRSFTIGSKRTIYLKSAAAGDVNIYTF